MSKRQQVQQSKRQNPSFQNRKPPANDVHVSNPAAIIQHARINPESLTSAGVLQLQRTIGNRAVGRLLSEFINPSTVEQMSIQLQKISEEKEPLQGEFENKPEEETCPSCIQRQEIPEEEEPLQGKMADLVQRQEIPEEEKPLQTNRENNTGLPDNLKAGVERLSGIDMSHVRVHYNSSKPAEVGALAFTQGTNIHVAPGQERHLPHEAWHVVQQAQGRVRPTVQMKGVSLNDDVGLEREADEMGEKGRSLFSSPFQINKKLKSVNNLGLLQKQTGIIQMHKGCNDYDPMMDNMIIYIVKNAGNVVYVGQTEYNVGIAKRFAQHLRVHSGWNAHTHSISEKERGTWTRFETTCAEQYWIDHYNASPLENLRQQISKARFLEILRWQETLGNPTVYRGEVIGFPRNWKPLG